MCDPVYILDQQNVNLGDYTVRSMDCVRSSGVLERERHQNVNHITDILQAPMFEEFVNNNNSRKHRYGNFESL